MEPRETKVSTGEPMAGSRGTAKLTEWDRLVRYVSDEDQTVRYGEPIVSADTDNVTDLFEAGKLEVRVCEGADALSAKPTSQRHLVKRLLGPLEPRDVPVVRCIGLNYRQHIIETKNEIPKAPAVFLKAAPSVADHDAEVPIPRFAQSKLDYEGELAIVIGRDAEDVAEADALDYVAGYTVGNDVSARDWQFDVDKAGSAPQWGYAKGFDSFNPLGPCLVSARILGDADGLKLTTVVSGETRQQSDTSDLVFGVRKLVAFCSQGTTLQRGSVILTGTPSGVGGFSDPPKYLKHGDEVAIEIAKIGRLKNKIAFED